MMLCWFKQISFPLYGCVYCLSDKNKKNVFNEYTHIYNKRKEYFGHVLIVVITFLFFIIIIKLCVGYKKVSHEVCLLPVQNTKLLITGHNITIGYVSNINRRRGSFIVDSNSRKLSRQRPPRSVTSFTHVLSWLQSTPSLHTDQPLHSYNVDMNSIILTILSIVYNCEIILYVHKIINCDNNNTLFL